MRKINKTKQRSLKGLYRWMKRYYLPELHRRIEHLPQEVAMLANAADKSHSSFYIL